MNTRAGNKYSELDQLIKSETNWHMAKVRCFTMLVCALIKLLSVEFVKLAQPFNSNATYDSNLRRIRCFFSKFYIDHDHLHD